MLCKNSYKELKITLYANVCKDVLTLHNYYMTFIIDYMTSIS